MIRVHRSLRLTSETLRVLAGAALHGVHGGRNTVLTIISVEPCAQPSDECVTTVVPMTTRCK